MKDKLKEWIKRYIPAEIFATIGAIAAAGFSFALTKNRILSAYLGTIGENIGYYGFIFIREHLKDLNKAKQNKSKHGVKGFLKTTRNLILEFGPAEYLDSLIVRPFCMYFFPIILGNYALGIIIGKIVADIVFYIPTIISYELRKKYIS